MADPLTVRVPRELLECQQLWPQGWVCPGGPRGVCLPYGFCVRHGGYVIRALFHVEHPLVPPRIYLTPAPVSGHYYAPAGDVTPRLCWIAAGQWQTRHTLTVAVASAMRFINEYRAGRAD
jgi:hypothetical protein